jgi:hypothetical protein
VNPLSEYFVAQAATHRATAAGQPEDPRYAQSADALEALAAYAEAGAQSDLFQMRYLLEHHVVDGAFAWPKGQCGRSIMHFGFDRPVRSEFELEQFLMDLCDMAKSDAARHIGSNEAQFERAEAAALAKRWGIAVERVHGALDAGRGIRHLFVVGIPAWHDLDAGAREQLAALDGVIVMPGAKDVYGDGPPLLVKNLPAVDEGDAQAKVAAIAGIDANALGVTRSARVL